MFCEDCKKNPATVVITVTAGGEITTRHLCQDCMKKMENSFANGDVTSFLSSLLSLMSEEPKIPQLTCSACGLTYREFQQTGKLGCAQCYQVFSQELRPLLQRIHGRSQHAGRTPTGNIQSPSHEDVSVQEPVSSSKRMDILRHRMEEAISAENFEEAARLRDKIRALADSVEDES